jgi:hypothetical protein
MRVRELQEFEGIHEGQEVIVAGNGVGLKNIPFAFLESRPLFVMNYFNCWVPFVKPDYWLVLDPLCFEGAEFVLETIKFVKQHHRQTFAAHETNTCFYRMMDKIEGFNFSPQEGLQYSTTAIAAAHIAIGVMKAKRVLLVGFDCTYGMSLYEDLGPGFRGISRIPHFYDPRKHFTGYADQWDEQFGAFAAWAADEHQAEIVNLSIPTKSVYLTPGDYREYWQPETEEQKEAA